MGDSAATKISAIVCAPSIVDFRPTDRRRSRGAGAWRFCGDRVEIAGRRAFARLSARIFRSERSWGCAPVWGDENAVECARRRSLRAGHSAYFRVRSSPGWPESPNDSRPRWTVWTLAFSPAACSTNCRLVATAHRRRRPEQTTDARRPVGGAGPRPGTAPLHPQRVRREGPRENRHIRRRVHHPPSGLRPAQTLRQRARRQARTDAPLPGSGAGRGHHRRAAQGHRAHSRRHPQPTDRPETQGLHQHLRG